MNLDLRSYLRQNPVIALVGATNDSTKYGNRIMRDLLGKGYRVIPVNKRARTVEEIPAYADLSAAKAEHKDIGLVVYVIPPKYTLASLAEARSLGLDHVWIQPGAGDDAVRSYLEANKFQYLMNACVMVESRN